MAQNIGTAEDVLRQAVSALAANDQPALNKLSIDQSEFKKYVRPASDRREEVLDAEFTKEPVPFQSVFNRTLHFREAQIHARFVKECVEFCERVGSRDVDIGDRLGCRDHPFHRCRSVRDRFADGIAIEKSADRMDEVQYASERDLAIRNVDRETVLLREVRAALRRIHEGSFGTCLECETSISPKRLAAVPWALLCIRCQQAADRDRQAGSDLWIDSRSKAA